MITRLSVKNFAIIDDLNLEFNKGLTIITGETGAGKSILLGALKLILGERADLQQLNDTSKKCIIEAHFDVSKLNLNSFFEEFELDYEDESIFRRELLPSGKSRAFINDTPVTLSRLKTFGDFLIDIHSQFNTQDLLDNNYQLQILDAYSSQLDEIKAYQKLYNIWNKQKSELKSLKEKFSQKEKEADYKQFLLEELMHANLKSGELDELEKEFSELENIEEIQLNLSEIINKLDSPEIGILSHLNESIGQLSKISGFGKEFEDFQNRMNSVQIELNDLKNEMSYKLDTLEANPEKLNELNERINLIHDLLSKHKVNTIDELIEIKEQLGEDEFDLHQLKDKIEGLNQQIEESEKDLEKFAQKISAQRKKSIPIVEKELLDSLSKLGMENSSLKFELKPRKEFSPNGKDEIEFLFSANKGMKLQTLGKAISGGERSRLMLAVKKSLAGKLELPTLILDEIDTGVSGKVANEVGNMMKEMSKNIQLISITHLPQVAAKANQHFRVQKKTSSVKTLTEVIELSEEQRIREIAELISGSDITETALSQAEELIKNQ